VTAAAAARANRFVGRLADLFLHGFADIFRDSAVRRGALLFVHRAALLLIDG
jgi:hypothetical protein